MAKVEKYCDVLASILPFEQRFYNKAIYVGHPLLDEIPLLKKVMRKRDILLFYPEAERVKLKFDASL